MQTKIPSLAVFSHLLAGVASLLVASSLPAATLTWDANGGTAPNPSDGSGVWTAANNWWNGTANVTWSANNMAIFGAGTDGSYAIDVAGLPNPAVSNIWFQSSGYTLTSATPQLVAFSSTVASTTNLHIRIDSGKTVTIGTNVTVQFTAATGNGLYIGAYALAPAPFNAGGTLNIENGATVRNTNTASGSLYIDGVGTVVNVKAGGSLIQGGTSAGFAVTIGQQTGATSTLNVQGGTVTAASASGSNSGLLVGNVGAATVNLSSGTITVAPTSTGVQLGRSGLGGDGTFNLDGGILSTPAVYRGGISGGGVAHFNFNGGTLKALADKTAFLTGLTRANIRNGGAIIDSGAFAVTIAQVLEHSDVVGDAVADGGLTKLGAGTLTLSGANNYNGITTVSNGTLVVSGSIAGSANVQSSATLKVTGSIGADATVASGATLVGNGTVNGAVTVSSGGTLTAGNSGAGNLTLGSLTLGAGSGDAQTINVTLSTAILNVNGALVNNGTTTINVGGFAGALPGTYSLITYAGPTVSSGFVLGTKPTGSTLQYNGSSIDLVIPDSLKWTGAENALWDTTTTNWQWFSAATATKYANGTAVLFDDTLFGNPDIALNSTVTPGAVTFNNDATTYSISGSGSIAGTGGVTKNGAGLLVLGNANTYSGDTTLLGTGLLAVTNSSALGTGTLKLQSARTDNLPTVFLSDGVTVTNPVVMDSTTGREGFYSTNGNNALTGPIAISGSTSSHLLFQNNGDPGTLFTVSGSISGPTFPAGISLRGAAGALGLIAGQIAINSQLEINGSADWKISSTNNSWTRTVIQGADGSLILGATNALASSGRLTFAGNASGKLDMAGFSQTLGGLECSSVSVSPGPVVGNSSTVSDSFLRLANGNYTFAGTLVDSIGAGTRKLSLEIQSGSQTLTGENTYSGTTTISGGTLSIGNGGTTGSIDNTALPIINNGTLAYNRSDAIVVTNAITGTGGVSLAGSVILRPAGSSQLSSGTIAIGSAQADTCHLELTGVNTFTNALAFRSRAYPASFPAHIINVSGTNILNPATDFTLGGGGNAISLQSDSGRLVLTKGVTTTQSAPRYLALLGAGDGEVQGPLSLNMGLVKANAGAWTLTGSSPMGGPTLVTGGTLIVNGSQTSAANQVTVSGASGSTLAGSGTIAGPVSIGADAALSPGDGIGTLTINNTLVLDAASTTYIGLNAASSTSDRVQGLTSVTYGGTLIVTNLGGTLSGGQSFQLFSAAAASGDFAVTNLPALGSGLSWNWNPASGTLSIAGGVAATPTNITFSVSGGTLSLTWPGSHLGWYAQSNAVNLASSNYWFDIAGSQAVTNLTFPISTSATNVFYRLRKP